MRHCIYIGIDAHSKKNVLWALNPETGEVASATLRDGGAGAILEWAGRTPACRGPLHFVYESGPTGFGLARAIEAAGHRCTVAAVTKLPRRQDRVKTDMRDAEFLARCLAAGSVHAVHVPTAEQEAQRHLSRLRGQLSRDLRAAKQRVSSFMLLTGTDYTLTKHRWTKTFFSWAEGAELGREADTFCFRALMGEVARLRDALAEVDRRVLGELRRDAALAARVARLELVPGIGRTTAFSLVAEVGDFSRFGSGPSFAHYLGLTPRVSATGDREARGRITKQGNSHLRRLLVEAAGAYARVSRADLGPVPEGVPPAVAEHARKCGRRLSALRRRLVVERGMGANRAKVALARELAEWVWRLMVMEG